MALFSLFTKGSAHEAFWSAKPFRFFCMGAAGWVICFFCLPRPLLVYVFGHELTHAIWVWLMG